MSTPGLERIGLERAVHSVLQKVRCFALVGLGYDAT